jgi:hypothetical protein
MRNEFSYGKIRDLVQAGDVIAFGGRGAFSNIIKAVTLSTVSHVGVVMESKLLVGKKAQPGRIVDVLESTTLNGKNGVQRNRLSERIEGYEGEMWWLPLRKDVRDQLDVPKFYTACLHEVGRPYDFLQAVLSGIHFPQWWSGTSRRFCSEVVVASLRAGGVKELSKVDPANVTPMELCAMNLYGAEYVQLKGKPKDIPRYNSRSPWLTNL